MRLFPSPGLAIWPPHRQRLGTIGTSPDQGRGRGEVVCDAPTRAANKAWRPEHTGLERGASRLHRGRRPGSPSVLCTHTSPEVQPASRAWPGLAGLGASRVEEAGFPGWNVQNVGWAPGYAPRHVLAPPTSLGPQFPPHKLGAAVGVRPFGPGAAGLSSQLTASGTPGAPGTPQTLLGPPGTPQDHGEPLRGHGHIIWGRWRC